MLLEFARLLDFGEGFRRVRRYIPSALCLGTLSMLEAFGVKRIFSYKRAFVANVGGTHFGYAWARIDIRREVCQKHREPEQDIRYREGEDVHL